MTAPLANPGQVAAMCIARAVTWCQVTVCALVWFTCVTVQFLLTGVMSPQSRTREVEEPNVSVAFLSDTFCLDQEQSIHCFNLLPQPMEKKKAQQHNLDEECFVHSVCPSQRTA